MIGYACFLFVTFIFHFDTIKAQDVNSNEIYKARKGTIPLYWNIPSFQCRSHNIVFQDLAEKYDIVQNKNDDFRGEKILILYDPGAFPAILKSNSRRVLRNGGVPQEGNLTYHLIEYENILEQLVDKNFTGQGVIDFESWRPIYRQNWASLQEYKDLSKEIERRNHPFWTDSMIEKEAIKRFEAAGRIYMEETLKLTKKLRPQATWGYYAYPYCFNMSPNNMKTQCAPEVKKENDRINWLFKNSDTLYPSLYMPQEKLNAQQRKQMITGRIEESQRLAKNVNPKANIIPYFWYKYQDTGEYLSKEDLKNSFATLKKLGVHGIILWGASKDVNSKQKCGDLYEYIDRILGPIWKGL